MKIAIVTLYTENISYYANITNINKADYCKKHNYDLYIYNKRFTLLNPNWDKIPAILNVLHLYDYVVWMDADAVFVNFDKKFEDIIDTNYSFHICNDPAILYSENFDLENFKYLMSMEDCFQKLNLYKIINCGVFICKNDKYCVDILKKTLFHRTLNNRNFNGIMEGPLITSNKITMLYKDSELETKCAYNDWPAEQGSLTEILLTSDKKYKIYNNNEFNSNIYNVNNLIYHKMGPKNKDSVEIFELFNKSNSIEYNNVFINYKNKKKIALLISGRIENSWEYSLDYTLKNIIDELEPTIFVSTYSTNNDNYENLKKFAEIYNIPFTKERFNIETFKIDENNDFYKKTELNENNNYCWGSMFFHLKNTFNMVKNYNETFDFLIKWRIDAVPLMKLPIDILFYSDKLVVPRNECCYNGINPVDYVKCEEILPNFRITAEEQKKSIYGWCPDHIFVGNYQTFDAICNFNFDEYYKTFKIKLDQHRGPEHLLNNILELNGIEWIFTKDIWFYTIRQVCDKTKNNNTSLNDNINKNYEKQEVFYKKIMYQ